MNDDLLLTTPSFFADGDPHALWSRLRREANTERGNDRKCSDKFGNAHTNLPLLFFR